MSGSAFRPDHAGYVAQVTRVTRENADAEYLLPRDAAATIRDAEESGVGAE